MLFGRLNNNNKKRSKNNNLQTLFWRLNNSYLCDLQQKNDVSVNLLNGPTRYRSTVQ